VDAHNALTGISTRHHHVFSKGIHLIVDRLTENRRVLTFLADDDRPFFVIPMGARTMIGTTDTPVTDPHVQVTDGDIEFVLDNINKRLCRDKPLCRADIISTRCGVRPLAVTAGADHERDFLQLSRKHAIDIDADRAHLSIFGGKLTDCINVGDEVCAAVRDLGLTVHDDPGRWYGEPPEAARQDFHRRAAAMNLDALTPPGSSAKLSTRLWRRYGNDAVGLLEIIAADPRQAEPLIEGTEHLRCEAQHARRYEMITKLEDYLRRRSKIALELRPGQLQRAPGLMRACEILFGDQARVRFDEYFDAAPETGETITPGSAPGGVQ
jgi:glycerol-3-phosphate dehydrogenase